jgi:hypothetical protein
MLIYETGNARWSQEQFAARFRTSLDVLQNWEQHRNEPDPIARNVLEMIKRNPVAAEWALWGTESGQSGERAGSKIPHGGLGDASHEGPLRN